MSAPPPRRPPRLLACSLFAGVAGVVSVAVPRVARAVDPFEIQVYDATANDKGQAGIELHVNRVFSGSHEATPPEHPPFGQTHFTLEPSYGVTDFWELGGYLQSTLRSDGHLDYSGFKLRSKLVTRPTWDAHWRLGLNVELSILPQDYDPDRVGGEIRPIAAWENDDWMFAVNPILGTSFGGGHFGDGPSFEPAFSAMWKIQGKVGVGLEYYADLGAVADPSPLRLQQHYLYEVVNLLAVPDFELNVGVGEGLTGASNGLVAKVIVGYGF